MNWKDIIQVIKFNFSPKITLNFRSTGYKVDKPMKRENEKVSSHFTLNELTKTKRKEYLERNRTLTDKEMDKLYELAKFAENVRVVVGAPMAIHSGYRHEELSIAVGSTSTSQHTKFEALDFHAVGDLVEETFNRLYRAVKNKTLIIGQLIFENDGKTKWIHISMKVPSRPLSRCGMVLKMLKGKYILLDQIKYEA